MSLAKPQETELASVEYSPEVLLRLAERQLKSDVIGAPFLLFPLGFFPRHGEGQLEL